MHTNLSNILLDSQSTRHNETTAAHDPVTQPDAPNNVTPDSTVQSETPSDLSTPHNPTSSQLRNEVQSSNAPSDILPNSRPLITPDLQAASHSSPVTTSPTDASTHTRTRRKPKYLNDYVCWGELG